ncbi:hypothetical protein KGQ71_04100 [Patescibacteria group bacterium]|nr:hypothetical protein [Patescibacteria group bacterium]
MNLERMPIISSVDWIIDRIGMQLVRNPEWKGSTLLTTLLGLLKDSASPNSEYNSQCTEQLKMVRNNTFPERGVLTPNFFSLVNVAHSFPNLSPKEREEVGKRIRDLFGKPSESTEGVENSQTTI